MERFVWGTVKLWEHRVVSRRLIRSALLASCLFVVSGAVAQPPTVTFPEAPGDETPGIQLPFNTSNGVDPFAGDTPVNYGKQAPGNFGWAFDTFQGSSIAGADSLGRYVPTQFYDSFDPPSPLPVVAMLENQDWVFHTELRYEGAYNPAGNGEFVLFAKHVPGDSGGTPDGREDRIFSLVRGADANSWSISVGNATGGWTTAISNLQHPIDVGQSPPEQYVDFDVHYQADQDLMDFYWDSQLVGSAMTGHGRYDVDYIQFEHKDSWGGTQSFRNFRLGHNLGDPAPDSIEGDYNADGVVDAADYVVWRKYENTAGFPGQVIGDGDNGTGTGTPDGIVDEDDYAFWVSRFGATTPLGSGGGASAVPEPTSVFMILACILSMSLVRMRRTCITTQSDV
jgi:hypothetical protein